MENEPEKTKAEWLIELESKSWSLEMTISGAATVAVSFFPGVIERGLEYYLENVMPSESTFAVVFPVMSYSFFMVGAWVLIAFFVWHLCMRALWVSAVGLHSAFPEGIQFDKLPNVSEFYKKLAKKKFGTLEQFIFRLDKRSNAMFAMAFALAMTFAGIGAIYLVFVVFMVFLRNALEPQVISTIGQIFYYLIIALGIVTLISNWWLKQHPEYVKLGNTLARIQLGFAGLFNPLFSKTSQYLTLTFMSNVSRRSYYIGLAVIVTLMTVSTIFVTFDKMTQLLGRRSPFGRSFYSNGSDQYQFSNAAYDALRSPEAQVPEICIPSEVVEGGFLPVFVKYPRYLDARMLKFCSEIPALIDTSLTKRAQRRQTDSLSIDCLTRFFQLRINDTLQPATEWLYTEKQGSKGLVSYIDTRGFPPGKNSLSVTIPSEDKLDSLVQFGRLHFWYVPRNLPNAL